MSDTLYSKIYKSLEGTGISQNPIVTRLNDMVIANQLKKPILIKNSFFMYMDPRPPRNTAAYYLANREYEKDETKMNYRQINQAVSPLQRIAGKEQTEAQGRSIQEYRHIDGRYIY